MLILLGVAVLLLAGAGLFLQKPVFGSAPRKPERLERIQKSAVYRDGRFENLLPTPMRSENVGWLKFFRLMLGPKSPRNVPDKPLPMVRQDIRNLETEGPLRVIWFGHSSYLLLLQGKRIWVDPVFSTHISPISLFGATPYPGTDLYQPGDLPVGDLIVLTHDHYDHMDYLTLSTWIKNAGPELRFLTSLGVGEHLEKWGVKPEQITELDWWESATPIPGFRFSAVPARHFSGRSLSRNVSLWSGFVLETDSTRILIGGDSGYGPHFAEIRQQFGAFDLVFLECGQYSELWPLIHMSPEETVRAARDLEAGALFPVHWGKFSLALHDWDEPVLRVAKEADRQGLRLVTPQMGETSYPLENRSYDRWWEGR